MQDPYRVLGVSQGASEDEIKKAQMTFVKRLIAGPSTALMSTPSNVKQITSSLDSIVKVPSNSPVNLMFRPSFNVEEIVYCRSAYVHADFAFFKWYKFFFSSC